jgi:hypothetical protein
MNYKYSDDFFTPKISTSQKWRKHEFTHYRQGSTKTIQ